MNVLCRCNWLTCKMMLIKGFIVKIKSELPISQNTNSFAHRHKWRYERVRCSSVFVCVGLCVSSPSSIFSCDTHNKLWNKTIPNFIWLIFQANGFGRLRSLFVPTIFYLLRKSKCLWWPEVKSRTLPSQQSTGFVWWWLGVKPSRPSYSKRARKKMRIWRNTMLCMWCNLYRRYILLSSWRKHRIGWWNIEFYWISRMAQDTVSQEVL